MNALKSTAQWHMERTFTECSRVLLLRVILRQYVIAKNACFDVFIAHFDRRLVLCLMRCIGPFILRPAQNAVRKATKTPLQAFKVENSDNKTVRYSEHHYYFWTNDVHRDHQTTKSCSRHCRWSNENCAQQTVLYIFKVKRMQYVCKWRDCRIISIKLRLY